MYDFYEFHIPDYTGKIKLVPQLNSFIRGKSYLEHKLLIFTKKSPLSKVMRGISADFRGRLDMAHIYGNQDDSYEIRKIYDIKKLPALVIT